MTRGLVFAQIGLRLLARVLVSVGVVALPMQEALAISSANAKEHGNSYLGLSQDRYLGSALAASPSPNYNVLAADLRFETESPSWNLRFNPVVEGATNVVNEVYFGVPEAFVEWRILPKKLRLTTGRQKRHWSWLDEEFGLGVWQPQLRWDYLRPRQQGLIGVFLDWELTPKWQLTLFASPVFLPDQGPNYRLRNGQFTSSNRWFMPPQSQLLLQTSSQMQTDVPLQFTINRPATESVVLNSSFGMSLQYRQDVYWSNLSYAYKPRSQIHIGVECSQCATLPEDAQPLNVEAVIHPRIVKHHVLTMESGVNGRDNKGWFSLTGDFTEKSGFPSQYEEASLKSLFIAGTAYERSVASLLGHDGWLKFGYMRVFDLTEDRTAGIAEGPELESSLDRYPYRELVIAEGRLRFLQRLTSHLEFKTRYNFSVPESGGWLTSQVEYFRHSVLYYFGLDVLGSETEPDSIHAGLYTRYRANDRIFGGVSYVF